MESPIENGGKWENFCKNLRGLSTTHSESMITQEERIWFERESARQNYYGIVQSDGTPLFQNLNFASVPHPSEKVLNHMTSLNYRLSSLDVSREERVGIWQEAREKACALMNHPDPRGVMLTGNTTQALGFFHWLSGMMHGKNRVHILHQILTTDIENSATYRTIATLGEDGNPYRRDALTTYSRWNVSPVQEGERHCSLSIYDRLKTRRTTTEDIHAQLERNIRPSLMLNGVPDTFVLSHVDRETGRELPVKELIAHARELKAKADPAHPHLFCVVDGAQALGNLPRVDWKEIGADMYVMSPHKTMGSDRLGVAFFNPDGHLTREGLKLLRHPDFQKYIPMYDGNFHPSLGLGANIREDHFYAQETGILRGEVNPLEVASFSKAVDELTEEGYLKGNDFSALDRHRKQMREQCKNVLADVSHRTGIPIVVPPIDYPTNFILPFRIGPEQAPVRRPPLWKRLLSWRKQENPEQFGHEIGRRLSERAVALTYFSTSNLFRASFDRDTSPAGLKLFGAVLEEVLQEIPELTSDQAS